MKGESIDPKVYGRKPVNQMMNLSIEYAQIWASQASRSTKSHINLKGIKKCTLKLCICVQNVFDKRASHYSILELKDLLQITLKSYLRDLILKPFYLQHLLFLLVSIEYLPFWGLLFLKKKFYCKGVRYRYCLGV